MKMKLPSDTRQLKFIGLTAIILVLGFSSVLAWNSYQENTKPLAKVKVVDTSYVNIVDTAQLRLFKTVYEKIDVNRAEFLIKGRLSTIDGADSTQHIANANYVYSRKGNQFYFKLGDIEMSNGNEVSTYVDHKNLKVMLTPSKKVIPLALMPDINKLMKTIVDEGYSVTGTLNKVEGTVSLLNPYHLTCKEYKLVYDATTLLPKRLYIRLSNFQEPENKQKDKTIDLDLSLTSDESHLNEFLAQQIVNKKGKDWTLSPAYSTYELINKLQF
ncbi:hypothetical protein EZ428_21570 [Pedobacter frigiditerrae]|uniref:Uncharacterized protein n=1 Tax=Pedobacter frigiditerrae TaxID=2530452 RepID=A0A4R0MMT0_9SPHI|nr:hypothetical protein [Pedobacter frigiditerrae]TCC87294.1 hypothetical protein EZ428_21570 [Pedobacter frigiditerrae]